MSVAGAVSGGAKSPGAVAHFLLLPELSRSPPNEAMIAAYRELGYEVDLYATGECDLGGYDPGVRQKRFGYGRRWLMSNAWAPQWRRYAGFSATAEDPLGIVGIFSRIHRRPMISLVDEIKSGDYAGDASPAWKSTCRAAIRGSRLAIVNDEARVALLRSYAGCPPGQRIIVYPGGYRVPPPPVDRAAQRRAWGIPEDALVVGASGGFNLTGGADWLVKAVIARPEMHAVIQPLGVDALSRFLLGHIQGREPVWVEPRRLDWHEAWSQAAALDIGMVVYLRKSDQFQLMGVSSNRLCMFLAMGVPVIASRQDSFRFLEDYDCGIMVDDADGFAAAVGRIRDRLPQMKRNAKRCWDEYVATPRRYRELVDAMREALAV